MNALKPLFFIFFFISAIYTFAQEENLDFCYDSDNTIVIDEAFTVVENMPIFNAAECYSTYQSSNEMEECSAQALEKIRTFPYDGEENYYVHCTMIIDTLGKCRNIEIIQSDNEALNELVLATVKIMPLWQPGTQRGHKVNVQITIPFLFLAD